MKVILWFVVCLTISAGGQVYSQLPSAGEPVSKGSLAVPFPTECNTPEEAELARLINTSRQAKGLKAITVIPELYAVARWHVIDLTLNSPYKGKKDEKGNPCDLHSWSEKGAELIAAALSGIRSDNSSPMNDIWKPWTPICYTADHKYAEEMWRKPREIADYPGVGYEIIYWTSAPISPTMAIRKWEGSPTERSMLFESGDWQGSEWKAMGVGIFGNYASVWLGSQNGKDNRKITACP